ncbi:hypothetical protein Syun_023377 [Stephania yunnanensis]|uniref:Uncharacterized protein n=1 Tax=Stephania yunnanensis TaxID=152371 RepID=A0AAP0F9R0_9MAGN
MPRQREKYLKTNQTLPRGHSKPTARRHASATNRVSPRQHSSLPPPIRGRHASPRQQEIHVMRDSTDSQLFARAAIFFSEPLGNISSSTDQKLDRMISMMEHLISFGEVQVNPAMDSCYSHNYGRYENSHYNNVNGVEIVVALNEGEDEMKIDVNSDKLEMPQIESEEDQLLVLVQPPTRPCTFGKPYKGVEVRERLQIFYIADTFVLDEPDMIDYFVLEVPD